MGMIIKDLCSHIVHMMGFLVRKALNFSVVQHLGVDRYCKKVFLVLYVYNV